MHVFYYELVDGHVVVKFEGVAFLIDTGAPSSVAEKASISFAGRDHVVQTNYMGITPRSLSDHIGTSINALIGADILNDFSMVIDPRTNELRLSAGNLDLSGVELPIESFMGIPIVEAKIEDNTIRMFFDTGAKLSYLDPEITGRYPTLGPAQDFYPGIGQFQTQTYRIPIKLGTETVELTVGNLPQLLQTTLMMANTSGILGTAILSHFVVGLSHNQQKLVLQRVNE